MKLVDKYAAEARMRGDMDSANKSKIRYQMVAAGQTCTFEIPSCSGNADEAVMAEVNRYFRLEK